jgi:molybdopterin-guanine dinucleotide biosynthesis protein A
MAGVEAALSRGRDALVVAWDMPFVTPLLLQALIHEAIVHDADVTVPESDSPYGFEPFCAHYSVRVRPSLAKFFDGGGGAARDFLGQIPRVHRIPISAVEKLGDPRRLFFSVNTPDDLERARAMAASPK